jgi:hypothetical protein
MFGMPLFLYLFFFYTRYIYTSLIHSQTFADAFLKLKGEAARQLRAEEGRIPGEPKAAARPGGTHRGAAPQEPHVPHREGGGAPQEPQAQECRDLPAASQEAVCRRRASKDAAARVGAQGTGGTYAASYVLPLSSVVDPVFGPPGSASVSQWYGSGSF